MPIPKFANVGGVGDERHKCPNSGGNRRAAGYTPCLHLWSEFKLMSSYAEAIERSVETYVNTWSVVPEVYGP